MMERMEFRIIKSPSVGTMEILMRRITNHGNAKFDHIDAVGLVQGKMIEMIYAADIAEKAVDVMVADVKGNCFQNMIMLAIFGDTAAVDAAIQEIKSKLEK